MISMYRSAASVISLLRERAGELRARATLLRMRRMAGLERNALREEKSLSERAAHLDDIREKLEKKGAEGL
jgi:hypothetical protein